MQIPDQFDERFLDWFRASTEAAWREIVDTTLEDYIAREVGGCSWVRDTRWLNGLTDDQIEQAERRWNLRFPPDYRLFLQCLHTVDRPMFCAGWSAYQEGQEQHVEPYDGQSFYDWLADSAAIQGRIDWLAEGLHFDVEHNALWLPSWGPRPSTLAVQKDRVRELVASAPRLIPIFGHRYLLTEPCQAGNPVFSIYQSDIIVYGPDLRTYLLFEFADLLRIDRGVAERMAAEGQRGNEDRYAAIPFWGELYAWNNRLV